MFTITARERLAPSFDGLDQVLGRISLTTKDTDTTERRTAEARVATALTKLGKTREDLPSGQWAYLVSQCVAQQTAKPARETRGMAVETVAPAVTSAPAWLPTGGSLVDDILSGMGGEGRPLFESNAVVTLASGIYRLMGRINARDTDTGSSEWRYVLTINAETKIMTEAALVAAQV